MYKAMYKGNPMSRMEIRKKAEALKQRFNIPCDQYVDVLKLLEIDLPKSDSKFNYEICEKEEMGSLHGLTFPDKHLIKLRADVYRGATEGRGRDRFTIAHEIGHLFMHEETPVSYARNREIKLYENTEWHADCFAGEFLMPERCIRTLDIWTIVKQFGVSHKAAYYQKTHI